jgi:hypothetical protein
MELPLTQDCTAQIELPLDQTRSVLEITLATVTLLWPLSIVYETN